MSNGYISKFCILYSDRKVLQIWAKRDKAQSKPAFRTTRTMCKHIAEEEDRLGKVAARPNLQNFPIAVYSPSWYDAFMPLEECKKAVAAKAASLIQDGMIVGLGTGSTAHYFIEQLIQRCKQGLKIQAVASSERSLEQARKGGIPLADINTLKTLDMYVDGADEIDPQKRMIKGGGGAMLREKILAKMSREMIVIIDESKLVQKLGNRPLPVEIVPFGHTATIHQLQLLGYTGTLRKASDNALYVTDNHNYLFDIHLDSFPQDPPMSHEQIISIPGVVDTGFFFDLAGRVVIGFLDGRVVVQ